MKSYLRIERLILVGFRKNYITSFDDGVNIIHGDSDTGKSSILEFINYLLGSSKIELADEIISSVKYASLEITINDDILTITRDIFKPNEFIEVYNCSFENISIHIPRKYAPNFKVSNAPDGYFSDFLMDKLNFPKLKLKVSPSQDISLFRRLSFRNIAKFTYVNQDDMGSKQLLGLTEWAKYTQTKEVFKYIFNLLDADISDVESQISEKTATLNKLRKKYENVTEFLRETGYESVPEIDSEIEYCDSMIDEIEDSLKSLNKEMISNSENYSVLKAYHSEFNLKAKGLSIKIDDISRKREQYLRLKNDYHNDIGKIRAIHIANKKIGVISDLKCNCPLCDSIISIECNNSSFLNSDAESLDEELQSLQKRSKAIEELISNLNNEQIIFTQERNAINEDLRKVSELLDTETKEMITPFLTQRDGLLTQQMGFRKRRENLVSDLKVRNHQNDILEKQSLLSDNLSKLSEELERLKESAPKIDGVLSELADHLNNFLTKVNIKNRTGIDISNNHFSPIVRNKDYFNITSGGLRTIISIAYMSSILKYSIFHDINHPRLLLLDTVGKYLGKNLKQKYQELTSKSEDLKEGISDPLKYEQIYNNLIEICTLAQTKKVSCQVIIVDNDIPENLIERLKSITVAHYSSIGENGLAQGLIDDIRYQ